MSANRNRSFTYEGAWRAGEITGQGVARYRSGDVYEGTFENGTRQGQGRLTYATGQVVDGLWENGQFVGAGAADLPPAPETPDVSEPQSQ